MDDGLNGMGRVDQELPNATIDDAALTVRAPDQTICIHQNGRRAPMPRPYRAPFANDFYRQGWGFFLKPAQQPMRSKNLAGMKIIILPDRISATPTKAMPRQFKCSSTAETVKATIGDNTVVYAALAGPILATNDR